MFCGRDVAKALGYARPNDAIATHCRATVKHSTPISGKMQDIKFIIEGDVYRFVAHNKLPNTENLRAGYSIRCFLKSERPEIINEFLAKAFIIAAQTPQKKIKLLRRNRLFQWLRKKETLMKNNVSYQKYIEGGYFHLKESAYETPYGTKTNVITLVTGKGQIYITEKLRKEYLINKEA